jgi:general stress protein 26
MNRSELLAFMRAQKWAVQASVSTQNAPQAAVIGIAVTDELEVVFDTLSDTRKATNLRHRSKIALVIGWDDAQTVQYEGVADEPAGEDLARIKRSYFARFPDGVARELWPGITYFRVRPTWIRYSDFRKDDPVVITFDTAALAGYSNR